MFSVILGNFWAGSGENPGGREMESLCGLRDSDCSGELVSLVLTKVCLPKSGKILLFQRGQTRRLGTNSLKFSSVDPIYLKGWHLQNRQKVRAQYIKKNRRKINILGPIFAGK